MEIQTMHRFWVLAMVVVVAVPVGAFAQAGPGGGMRGPGQMDYVNELNMTKEQLALTKEIQRESRKKAVGIRSKMQIAKIDFDDELQREKPDTKILGRLIDEIAALHAQQYKEMLESKVKMMSLLTVEQKHKLTEQSLMGMRGRMMGMDGDMGAGSMPGSRGGTPPTPPGGN
jgi:Spy/CpxP family protein refolding chaperone